MEVLWSREYAGLIIPLPDGRQWPIIEEVRLDQAELLQPDPGPSPET